MDTKSDISKIDEQIRFLKETGLEEKKNKETIRTKKVYAIKDLKDQEEVTEDTKKIEKKEDILTQTEEIEKEKEKVVVKDEIKKSSSKKTNAKEKRIVSRVILTTIFLIVLTMAITIMLLMMH